MELSLSHIIGKLASNLSAYVVGLFMLVILACGIYQVCVREWLNVAIQREFQKPPIRFHPFLFPGYSLPRQPAVRQGCRLCKGRGLLRDKKPGKEPERG